MDLTAIVLAVLLPVSIIGIIAGLMIYGSKVILKCILAFVIIVLAGWVGMTIGLEYLGGYPEFGCVIAVAVMGMFLIMFNDRSQPRS